MEIIISCICSLLISAFTSWFITGCMALSIKEGIKKDMVKLQEKLRKEMFKNKK